MTGTREENIPDPAVESQRLLRRATTGALATLHHKSGVPYASLAAVAATPAGEPIVLLSDLALHTKNLKANPAASLLLASAPGNADLLDNPRVTLMGALVVSDAKNDRDRYLRRYPDSDQYAGFGDFAFYRLAVENAHYIGGFGRIHALDRTKIITPPERLGEIVASEHEIIAHMNDAHGDAVSHIAAGLLGAQAGPWQMIGCDTAGCDLRLDDNVLRFDFPKAVETAGEMRTMLAELARNAKAGGGGS